MPRKFHDLADLQLEDAKAFARRQRSEEKAAKPRHGWLWRKFEVWTERFEHLGKWAKSLGIAAAAISTLWTLGRGAVSLIRHAAGLYQARSVAPAETPANGIASTTVDRVPMPTPPKP